MRSYSMLITAAAAMLHAVSWLDERYFPLAWIGLALLFWSVRGKSTLSAIASSFAFGCIMLATSFHWATNTLAYTLNCEPGDALPYFSFAALVLWESIPFALLGYVFIKGDRGDISLWVTPLFWVLVEVFWPRVFPWYFAHSQTGFTSFLQAAELGGAPLVSCVFVAGCVGISQLISSNKSASFQAEIMMVIVFLCSTLGFLRKSHVELQIAESHQPNAIQIGVVQIDPSYTESTEKMRREIDKFSQGTDLIVLPESTLGTYSSEIQSLDQITRGIRVARAPFINVEPLQGLRSDLLVGGKSFAPGAAEEGPYQQTAFVIGHDGGIRSRYFKRYLLPIGEYAPLESLFPQFHDWVQLGHYIKAGESAAPVELSSGAKIGVLVCYEDTVADASRTTVAEGAEVLVCIINGSAFESPVALEQHRRLSMLRAVENRRPFLRCAATGASCYISPTGEQLRSLPHFTEGSFQASVARLNRLTIYTQVGYLFPYACAAALVAYGLFAWRLKLRRATNRKSGAFDWNPTFTPKVPVVVTTPSNSTVATR